MATPEEAAAAAAAAAQKPWFDGVDSETVGYLQNRGLHDKPVKDVALAAINAHREAEKKLGVPADQLLRMPDAKDPAAVKSFWQRLGAPAEPKDYDFPDLKDKDGKPIEKMDKIVRDTAAELNLPKDAATRLVASVVKAHNEADTEAKAAAATKLDEEKKLLATNWGAQLEANKLVAREGAKKLGLDPEAVSALEGMAGYAKTMEALRKVGAIAGEDVFVPGKQEVGTGAMSVDAAMEKKAALKADGAFVTRYLNGDAVAVREMTQLDTIIAGAKS